MDIGRGVRGMDLRQTWMITWRIDCVPKVVIPFIDHL